MLAMLTSACTPSEPLPTVDYVDLKRFMGDWYVIASIPTFIEPEAFNAIVGVIVGAGYDVAKLRKVPQQ
jgi:apolipoprotein D and lipocalin family protein